MPTEPFFVVGSVRSGTTLLRLILGHHSQVCRCEEMEFVVGDLIDDQITSDTTNYIRELKLNRGYRGSGYTVNEQLPYPDIVLDFLVQRLAIDGKPTVGATVHHDFDQLPELWPDARYIFIRRDPRDVARSCVQMGWAGTTWHGAEFWLKAEQAWFRLCEKVPPEKRFEVRFEDLVADAEGLTPQICTFLDLQYEPEMLNIHVDTTYSRPDPKAARSWRDTANEDEIAQVEARVGLASLNALGYEPSNVPELPNGFTRVVRIPLQEILHRVSAKIKLYGLGLWMSGVLSRRLPFQRWREQVQIKTDNIDNLNLK